MIMNYFEYHGVAIYDNERLNVLKNATFCADVIKITKYEPYVNSKQEQYLAITEFSNSKCFVYQNQLYCFFTDMYGRISSFFELGNKEGYLSRKNGCYYEFEYIK